MYQWVSCRMSYFDVNLWTILWMFTKWLERPFRWIVSSITCFPTPEILTGKVTIGRACLRLFANISRYLVTLPANIWAVFTTPKIIRKPLCVVITQLPYRQMFIRYFHLFFYFFLHFFLWLQLFLLMNLMLNPSYFLCTSSYPPPFDLGKTDTSHT